MNNIIQISNCPCCQSPLLNEEVFFAGNALWRKSCALKTNHKFSIHYSEPLKYKKQIIFVEVAVSNNLSVRWNIKQQKLIVRDGYFRGILPKTAYINFDVTSIKTLPYFEPDFSDYPKLINKLKTMVAFL